MKDSETTYFQTFIDNHVKIRNSDTHHQLQEDLVEHMWQHHTAVTMDTYKHNMCPMAAPELCKEASKPC
jgi:hypothetical protein